MVNKISLAGYCCAIGISLALYYAAIVSIFFKKDINAIRSFLRTPIGRIRTSKSSRNIYWRAVDLNSKVDKDSFCCETDDDTIGRIVQSLLDELQAFFEQASQAKINKGELVSSLHLLLDKYPHIKTSSYHSLINHLIEIHSLRHCSIHLINDEIELLWKD